MQRQAPFQVDRDSGTFTISDDITGRSLNSVTLFAPVFDTIFIGSHPRIFGPASRACFGAANDGQTAGRV
jgi:hypothetical protein